MSAAPSEGSNLDSYKAHREELGTQRQGKVSVSPACRGCRSHWHLEEHEDWTTGQECAGGLGWALDSGAVLPWRET